MNRKHVFNSKPIKAFSSIIVIAVVIILLLPSMVQAETTREVDIGTLRDKKTISFSFSQYSFVTFNIKNVTEKTYSLVNISGFDDNYPMSLQRGSNNSVTFGNLDTSYSRNILLLKFDSGTDYKLRMQVNDDMDVVFEFFNNTQLNLSDEVNFYGSPVHQQSGSYHIDFSIPSGKAHSANLYSSSNITYTLIDTSSYVTNESIKIGTNIHLSNKTKYMKISGSESDFFHLKLTTTTTLPTIAGDNTYYENQTVIIPVNLSTYNSITSEYLNIATDNYSIASNVILSYSIQSNDILANHGNINLTYKESELYVENGTSRQMIGDYYELEYINTINSTINFSTPFEALKRIDIKDFDGDGYPLVRYEKVEIIIDKNGSEYYSSYTDLGWSQYSGVDDDDSNVLSPITYKDIDRDTLGNHIELLKYSTDPADGDTDDDGLGDGFEAVYWNYDSFIGQLDWLELYLPNLTLSEKQQMFGPNGDIDQDGISNILDFDSDGDSLGDGMEYNGYEAPIGLGYQYFETPPFNPDNDLDGLNDGAEAFGYHKIKSIDSQDYYSGDFFQTGYFEDTPDGFIEYSVVLMESTDYVKYRYTPIVGENVIRVIQRVYIDDYFIDGYNESKLKDLENITKLELFDEWGMPIPYDNIKGTVSVTFESNDTYNITLGQMNILVELDAKFAPSPSAQYVEIKLKRNSTFQDRNFVTIDSIEVLRVGLDPTDSDYDDDGLGDGTYTKVGTTYYNTGELSVDTSPLLCDSDGDGLNDGTEIDLTQYWNRYNYTNPNDIDTDNDGLLDYNNIDIDFNIDEQKFNEFISEGISYVLQTPPTIYRFFGETQYGTSSLSFDTDNDGLLDGPDRIVQYFSEEFYGFIAENITGTYNVDPISFTPLLIHDPYLNGGWERLVDENQDYIGQREYSAFLFYGEEEVGTSPLINDTDTDSMPDSWEVRYGLNPLSNDANNDADNDNLSNLQEYNYYRPNGYSEIWWYGTNPKDEDSDLDGITDGNESLLGTDPLFYDTDGDGLPDGWEDRYALNPLDNGSSLVSVISYGNYNFYGNGTVSNGSEGDPDFDGIINLYEYEYEKPVNWLEFIIKDYWVTPQLELDSPGRPAKGTYWNGLLPFDPDYDNDGLLDGGMINLTNPSDQESINFLLGHGIVNETEGNNYTFFNEGFYQTDIRNNDTDYDNLTDGDEVIGLYVNISVRRIEWENETILIQTNPIKSDTDDDGFSDEYELNNYLIEAFSNPLLEDTDGDGFTDFDEYLLNTSIKNRDSDFDNIPDNLEILPWTDLDNDTVVNMFDNDANDNNKRDDFDVIVYYRASNYTFPEQISVLLNESDLSLTKYMYNKTIYNASTLNLTPLIHSGKPVLSLDGSGIYHDENNSIYFINTIINNTIINVTKYVAMNNSIPNSKNIVANYSLAYLETYEWSGLLSNDSDGDGIPNSIEGFTNNSGFDFQVLTYEFELVVYPESEDTRQLTFVYNGQVLAPPKTLVNKGIEERRFYEWSINQTTVQIQTDDNEADTDGDGLLDGRDVILHNSSNLITSWKAKYNYSFDGEYYTFYGEQEPTLYEAKPYWNPEIVGTPIPRGRDYKQTRSDDYDSDDDGLLDGFNLVIYSNDSRNRYNAFASNGIVYTQINENTRLFYGERSYDTNPNNNNTDGMLSNAYKWYWDNNDTWHEFDTWVSKEVLNESRFPAKVYDWKEVHTFKLLPQYVWDFILDGEEVINGTDGNITDPTLSDTDGDGFGDSAEIDYWNLSTDPKDDDMDDDNVSDYREIVGWRTFIFGNNPDSGELFQSVKWVTSDPYVNMTDGKMLDGEKKEFGGDPRVSDSDGDSIDDVDERIGDNRKSLFIKEIIPPEIKDLTVDIYKKEIKIKISIPLLGTYEWSQAVSGTAKIHFKVNDTTGLSFIKVKFSIAGYSDTWVKRFEGDYPEVYDTKIEGEIVNIKLNIVGMVLLSLCGVSVKLIVRDKLENENISVYEKSGILDEIKDFISGVIHSFIEFATECFNRIVSIFNFILNTILSKIKLVATRILTPVLKMIAEINLLLLFPVFQLVCDGINYYDIDWNNKPSNFNEFAIIDKMCSPLIEFIDSDIVDIVMKVSSFFNVVTTIISIVQLVTFIINPTSAIVFLIMTALKKVVLPAIAGLISISSVSMFHLFTNNMFNSESENYISPNSQDSESGLVLTPDSNALINFQKGLFGSVIPKFGVGGLSVFQDIQDGGEGRSQNQNAYQLQVLTILTIGTLIGSFLIMFFEKIDKNKPGLFEKFALGLSAVYLVSTIIFFSTDEETFDRWDWDVENEEKFFWTMMGLATLDLLLGVILLVGVKSSKTVLYNAYTSIINKAYNVKNSLGFGNGKDNFRPIPKKFGTTNKYLTMVKMIVGSVDLFACAVVTKYALDFGQYNKPAISSIDHCSQLSCSRGTHSEEGQPDHTLDTFDYQVGGQNIDHRIAWNEPRSSIISWDIYFLSTDNDGQPLESAGYPTAIFGNGFEDGEQSNDFVLPSPSIYFDEVCISCGGKSSRDDSPSTIRTETWKPGYLNLEDDKHYKGRFVFYTEYQGVDYVYLSNEGETNEEPICFFNPP